MNDCIIPWCDNEVTDVVGEWWHSRFCDEHISTIERDSCVYLYLNPYDINGASFDELCRKFVERIRGCTIRRPDVLTKYDVEKMRYVIFFDVGVLRKKIDDRDKIFIEKELDCDD